MTLGGKGTSPDPVEGELRKQDGMALAGLAKAEWLHEARATWLLLGLDPLTDALVPVTSEDVTRHIGLPVGEVGTNRNNAVGSLVSGLVNAHAIERVGWVKSTNPQGHAATIGKWVLTPKGVAHAKLLRAKRVYAKRGTVLEDSEGGVWRVLSSTEEGARMARVGAFAAVVLVPWDPLATYRLHAPKPEAA